MLTSGSVLPGRSTTHSWILRLLRMPNVRYQYRWQLSLMGFPIEELLQWMAHQLIGFSIFYQLMELTRED